MSDDRDGDPGARTSRERVRGLAGTSRIDLAALAWIALLLVNLGAEVYVALRRQGPSSFVPTSDGWTRVELLAGTAPFLVLSAPVAIALAICRESRASRLALRLATFAGAWVVCAGLLGVLSAFHNPGNAEPGPGISDKLPQGVMQLCIGALGLVIAAVAWQLAAPRAESVSRPAAEPPLVELS